MYARVVVDTGATSSIDSLTYELPSGLVGKVEAGSCVLVPLGSRQAIGYVIGLEEISPVEKTRSIISNLESPISLTEDMLRLARWISAEYLCPLPRVVAAMLPAVFQCRVRDRVRVNEPNGEQLSLTPSEKSLVEKIGLLSEDPTVDSLCAGEEREAVQRILRRIEAKGIISRRWEIVNPTGKPRVMRGVRLKSDIYPPPSLTPKQLQAVDTIRGLNRDVSVVELTQRHGISRSVMTALEEKGVLEPVGIVFRRAPMFFKTPDVRVRLGGEQERAVDAITECIRSRTYCGHLLFGVTASGKTEVYLRCIEQALSIGRTCLVLLPEIAITTQVMNIFKSRFGDEVAVLHSALSPGERFDEWVRIQRQEAKVVLGARSAVFAPLADIGLVVVDEEHESSYKQDTAPRYNGRDVAIWRAMDAGAALVLGSATPSIESYHLARRGDYRLLTMPSRIENRLMPKIHLVDLRKEWAKGRAAIFSSVLEDGIRMRLERGEQVMLLQNRRAYSTFLLCRECGLVAHCPNCAVTLKFHSAEKKLSCHHCDYNCPAPTICPSCGGSAIRRFGIGTERVEEETKNTFPNARVLRMDKDTTSRRHSHGSILNAFRQGEADILVGTQMIAKGLDFPRVTLVGVISADTSLNLPDFRASERTFQLLAQVSGRSGRGTEPGEVVIQTFDPENYAIQCAVNHDYVGFYDQEIEMRRELNYPPFASLANIVSRDPDERTARARLDDLVKAIKCLPMSERKGVELVGPVPAVLSKLRGEYRWHLMVRSKNREAGIAALRKALDQSPALRKQIVVDIDPVSML